MTPRVLLVDDDSAFRSVYVALLRQHDYEVDEADDRPSVRSAFSEGRYPVVLLDLMLPPDGTAAGGVELLRELLATDPSCKIVVVSGAGDTRAMLDAVAAGAYDFITKPADPDVLLTVVGRAMQRARLERQLAELQSCLTEHRPAEGMVGDAPAMRAAMELADRVAASELPVLILGENGTGKEMMARYVHDRSGRRAGPFVAVNCGAIPEQLYESTLFGHRKGAFTGATRDHTGLFGQADGGTLFLDEIGDMPATHQVKLLRALESGEIAPVGAPTNERVDVRVVSATNQDLPALLESGAFREDLYWRIKGAEVTLPPLRERPSDIPLLARVFLARAATLTADGQTRSLSPAAEQALVEHGWPGNIRQLKHEMQRATVLVGERPVIDLDDLSFATSHPAPATDATLQQKVETLERREIELALREHHGNRTHAAEALGLSRQGLLKKMQRYGLS